MNTDIDGDSMTALRERVIRKALEVAEMVMDDKSDVGFGWRVRMAKSIIKRCDIPHPILEEKFTGNFCKLRFEIFKRDNFKCVYCGRTAKDNVELRVDHVHPRSKGGCNSPDNLVTSCHECNAGKSDTLLMERSLSKVLNAKS